jgi:hypothetical protein
MNFAFIQCCMVLPDNKRIQLHVLMLWLLQSAQTLNTVKQIQSKVTLWIVTCSAPSLANMLGAPIRFFTKFNMSATILLNGCLITCICTCFKLDLFCCVYLNSIFLCTSNMLGIENGHHTHSKHLCLDIFYIYI